MFNGMQWLIDIIKSTVTGVPAGTIILWTGLKDDIPTGYVACDGENGTPDLRGFFIKGAGGDNPPLGTGGALTHQHAFVSNYHTHQLDSGSSLGGAGENDITTNQQTCSGNTYYTNHLPPFVNLWYIMKT